MIKHFMNSPFSNICRDQLIWEFLKLCSNVLCAYILAADMYFLYVLLAPIMLV